MGSLVSQWVGGKVCVWPDKVMMGELCEPGLICPDKPHVSYFQSICYMTSWFDRQGSTAISAAALTISTKGTDRSVVSSYKYMCLPSNQKATLNC